MLSDGRVREILLWFLVRCTFVMDERSSFFCTYREVSLVFLLWMEPAYCLSLTSNRIVPLHMGKEGCMGQVTAAE